jgi:protein-S-isoprenylcysteine O-methyltransferase Ste14
MGALVGGLVVFGALGALVCSLLDSERDADDVSGFTTLGVWFAYLVHADTVVTAAYITTGRLSFLPHTAFLVLGLAVVVVGFIVFAWSSRVLVRDGAFQGLVSTRLVTGGPYARVRHPEDLGWGLMLLGVAIAGRSVIALALVGVFAVFVDRLWRADERALARRFGAAFDAWRAVTPRLPRRPAVSP